MKNIEQIVDAKPRHEEKSVHQRGRPDRSR